MKKILSIVMVALLCCVAFSCNEKPAKLQEYKFVKVTTSGEQVETFEAKNDTDALKQYFKRMEKIIIENLDKQDSGIEAMYVISPEGDTLNTNMELLDAVTKDLPTMTAPAPEATAPEAPKAQ